MLENLNMSELETNLFRIVNLRELGSTYRTYRIKNLRPAQFSEIAGVTGTHKGGHREIIRREFRIFPSIDGKQHGVDVDGHLVLNIQHGLLTDFMTSHICRE